MKRLITVLSVFLCATMLVACGKKEILTPSKYERINEVYTQSVESSIQPTNEKWQNSSVGFTYEFKNGRTVDCIRLNTVAITCDWGN